MTADSGARTGAQYLKGLEDRRSVWVNGDAITKAYGLSGRR